MTFIRTLEAEGTTLERHRQRIRDQYIERAMREKNVSSGIIISPHKVEAYYQEHLESYKLPDRVKLRLIVFNGSSDPDAPQPRKLADEILGKINGGASFAEMATLYSDDRMHQQGGDRGWVKKGELRKELDEAAFSLKPGERSGVIETPEACYLAQVESVEAAHYSPLSEVRGQIEKDLQDRERTRLQQQWIGKLRKKTFVSYY
jgi:parvulin-like peptidyl-prolyl isomerase